MVSNVDAMPEIPQKHEQEHLAVVRLAANRAWLAPGNPGPISVVARHVQFLGCLVAIHPDRTSCSGGIWMCRLASQNRMQRSTGEWPLSPNSPAPQLRETCV
jgi:hypothetical protein